MPTRSRISRALAALSLSVMVGMPLVVPAPVFAQQAARPSAPVQSLLDAALKARNIGNFAEAVRLYGDALKIAQSAKDTPGEANVYIGLGNTHFTERRYADALAAYEKALPLKQQGDSVGAASVQSNIGNAYLRLNDATKALAAYQAALPVLEKANAPSLPNTLIGLGAAQDQLNQSVEAAASYNRALELYKAAGNAEGVANVQVNLGALSQKMNKPAEAAAQYEAALITFRQANSKQGVGVTLNNLGSVYITLGETEKGIASYLKLAAFYKDAGDEAGEAGAWGDLGAAYADTARGAEAIAAQEKSLTLYRASKDERGEAKALTALGYALKQKGAARQAVARYQAAQSIYQKLGEAGDAAALNINIANARQQFGETQVALALYEQSLPALQAAKNTQGEAAALNGIGGVYLAIGDPLRSLGFFDKSMAVSRAAHNRKGEADTLMNGGTASRALENTFGALGLFGQALKIYQDLKDVRGEASALTNIGNTFYDGGQIREAIRYYEEALPLFVKLQDKRSQAITLGNLGGAYALRGEKGDKQKGIASLEQALPIVRAADDKYNEAMILTNLGSVHRAINQPDKALLDFQAALAIQKEIGNRRGEANALVGVAETKEAQKKYAEAEVPLKEALTAFEDIRSGLGGLSEAKVVFLASTIGPYQRYIRLQIRQNNIASAFETVQKTKARALLDLMAGGRVNIAGSMTAEERNQEKSLRQTAEKLNQQMLREATVRESGAAERIVQLRLSLAKAESDIATFRNGIYVRHPELAPKRAAKTATLADMTALLPDDTALLEYAVLKSGEGVEALDQTVCFVVTKTDGIATVKMVEIKVPFETLYTSTNAFRKLCANPASAYQSAAKTLYNQLVAPAAPLFAGKKRLIICPDGPLWDVPFAALLDGNNKPLLAGMEIDYAYSATGAQAATQSRKMAGRPVSTGTLFAVGNPFFGDASRFGSQAVPAVAPAGGVAAPTDKRAIDMMSRAIDMMSRGGIDMMSRSIDMMSRGGIDMMSRGGIDMMSRGGIDMMSRAGIDMMSRGGIDMMSRGGIDMMSRDGRITALPGTQREVDALKSAYADPLIVTGEKAQESIVRGEAGKYKYIHIASHAFASDSAPLSSGIILAAPPKGSEDDGILSARELFDMNLSADMVCLSACNTARGQTLTGEGVVGLTWALFVAGSPTTVVSQWAVNDDSTALLMQGFYGNLAKNGDKGDSLRRAALSLMNDGKHAHPYFWAPFVLFGDWK